MWCNSLAMVHFSLPLGVKLPPLVTNFSPFILLNTTHAKLSPPHSSKPVLVNFTDDFYVAKRFIRDRLHHFTVRTTKHPYTLSLKFFFTLPSQTNSSPDFPVTALLLGPWLFLLHDTRLHQHSAIFSVPCTFGSDSVL